MFWNFLIYKVLWTLNFFIDRGFCAPIFFGHTKFEVKSFLEFFSLLSALDQIFQRGVWVNNFWSC